MSTTKNFETPETGSGKLLEKFVNISVSFPAQESKECLI